MEPVGPILVVLSIPLMLRWVPRNPLYGFRVAATLRDDATWYDVNASSGRQLCVLGLVMVAIGIVLPLSIRPAVRAGVAILGLVVITIVSWRRANRMDRQR